MQLNLILGKKCWSIVGGLSAGGSIISLQIGKKQKRDEVSLKLMSNGRQLPKINRLFKGEYILLVYCPWRIDKDLLPYCGWDEKKGKRSPMRRALRQLFNKKITGVELNKHTLDLTLSFEGGYSMKIFTEFSINMDYGDCSYILFAPLNRYIAYKNAEMGIEEREKFFPEP